MRVVYVGADINRDGNDWLVKSQGQIQQDTPNAAYPPRKLEIWFPIVCVVERNAARCNNMCVFWHKKGSDTKVGPCLPLPLPIENKTAICKSEHHHHHL